MNSIPSSEPARETLRREHAVRLVAPSEEGCAAAEVPGGVYGFTSSPALASPLFAKRQYRNFEVHHLPNGTVSLVGFVSRRDAPPPPLRAPPPAERHGVARRLRLARRGPPAHEWPPGGGDDHGVSRRR